MVINAAAADDLSQQLCSIQGFCLASFNFAVCLGPVGVFLGVGEAGVGIKNGPWVYVPFNLQFTNGRPSSLIVCRTWHWSCCYCDCCLWRMDRVKWERGGGGKYKYRMRSGEGDVELIMMTIIAETLGSVNSLTLSLTHLISRSRVVEVSLNSQTTIKW